MPQVSYVSPDGSRTDVQAREGDTVMQTAVSNGVEGIVAECGGNAMCATCHVYVQDTAQRPLPSMGDVEDSMLDFTADPRGDDSRLSCQIRVTQGLDGLEVRLPENQT